MSSKKTYDEWAAAGGGQPKRDNEMHDVIKNNPTIDQLRSGVARYPDLCAFRGKSDDVPLYTFAHFVGNGKAAGKPYQLLHKEHFWEALNLLLAHTPDDEKADWKDHPSCIAARKRYTGKFGELAWEAGLQAEKAGGKSASAYGGPSSNTSKAKATVPPPEQKEPKKQKKEEPKKANPSSIDADVVMQLVQEAQAAAKATIEAETKAAKAGSDAAKAKAEKEAALKAQAQAIAESVALQAQLLQTSQAAAAATKKAESEAATSASDAGKAKAAAAAALAAQAQAQAQQQTAQEQADALKVQLLDHQQKLAKARKTPRWGDGVEFPEKAGPRTDFLAPMADFQPKTVRVSIGRFGHNAARLDELESKGQVLHQQLQLLEPPIAIDPGHAAAIYAYTEEDQYNLYGNFNKACRTPHSKDPNATAMMRSYRYYYFHLEKAVSTLTPFNGTVYRGIDFCVPAQAYVENENICWHQFSSSSKLQSKAKQFVRQEGMRLIGSFFILKVKTGKDIAAFSAFPGEMEVLIPPNTYFTVTRKIEGGPAKEALLSELSSYDLTNLLVYQLDEM